MPKTCAKPLDTAQAVNPAASLHSDKRRDGFRIIAAANLSGQSKFRQSRIIWVDRRRAAASVTSLSAALTIESTSLTLAIPGKNVWLAETRPSLGNSLRHPGEQPDFHPWPSPRISLRAGSRKSRAPMDLRGDILNRNVFRCPIQTFRQSLDRRAPTWPGRLVH